MTMRRVRLLMPMGRTRATAARFGRQQSTAPHRGLTLIELLVVIVILTTLVAGVLPVLSPNNDTRKIREAEHESHRNPQQQAGNHGAAGSLQCSGNGRPGLRNTPEQQPNRFNETGYNEIHLCLSTKISVN